MPYGSKTMEDTGSGFRAAWTARSYEYQTFDSQKKKFLKQMS